MKKIILLILFAFFTITYSFARARIPVCIPCEKLEEIKDLPNDELTLVNGEYLNLGYIYNEYGAVFVPAWNSNGRYVLINEAETTYYDITDEQLEEYKKTFNLELSANPLSFWKKFGGKLIYLLLIAIILYGKFGKDTDDDEESKIEA